MRTQLDCTCTSVALTYTRPCETLRSRGREQDKDGETREKGSFTAFGQVKQQCASLILEQKELGRRNDPDLISLVKVIAKATSFELKQRFAHRIEVQERYTFSKMWAEESHRRRS